MKTRTQKGCRRSWWVGRLIPGILLAGLAAEPARAEIIWTDGIQADAPSWGFGMLFTQHPIEHPVPPDDANGANLSRVPNPLGEGFALRHAARFDAVGSRVQLLISSYFNPVIEGPAKSAEGVWVAQEWYFPAALRGGTWLNLWDWQSTDLGGGHRWHTSPGLMLSQDGSMKIRWAWGGPAKSINPMSDYAKIPLPVGRWFDIEMHYMWTENKTATLTLWIDGELVLEQRGVQTRAASHSVVETQSKFYGAGDVASWSPTPSLKYVRNVRVGNSRIWQGPRAGAGGVASENVAAPTPEANAVSDSKH